ncbi:unnamed protein product [Caenorhabditis bovis]|uniref:Glycosyltransferase family 92 protein n=1 Tax=Caenorhabditis bovis TaxID=2654633 RepID=A0A8S1EKW5_9PELO|nr:unnamed protein product [Caenorhabditis bovis]
MQVNSEDITVAWGKQPHPLDAQYGKWRLAVFQDVQEAVDASKLYFLYDPELDELSGTTGLRKGYPGLIIFDLNLRCFAGEISLHCPGKMKQLFSLKCPSPQGGSSFILITEEEIYGQIRLNVLRIDLAQDGLSVANVRPLVNTPLQIGGEYICTMRDDIPEIIVMGNPGLQVWRIDCMAESAQQPVANFTVPGADLTHFYDGFVNNGRIIFLSATPDNHFDNTRVHIINLNNPQTITSQNCSPDPNRGMPIPRKLCGLDSISNAILMAGGEIDRGNGVFERLTDYWVLDTRTFQWTQVPATMSCPLIEPRLTSAHSGNIYVWGDFDQPLPGMPPEGTHLRILRVTGLEKANNPPGYTPYATPAPPAYPSLDDKSTPYPPAPSQGGYPPAPSQGGSALPPYPAYNPNQGNYGNASYQGGPSGQYPQNSYATGEIQIPQQQGHDLHGSYATTPSGQTAFYPKKKKSCSIHATVYCRYFDRNKKEIDEPVQSLIYPLFTIYCPRKENIDGIAISETPNLELFGYDIEPVENKVFKGMQKYDHHLAHCVAPIFGSEPKWMYIVEMIEHYKLQGVTKFYVYYRELSKYDMKLLKSYEDTGEVEIINVPSYFLDNISQQLYGISDCLLRSKTVAKWSIFSDIDERMLMVNASETLGSFLSKLANESIGSVLFRQRWIMKRKKSPEAFTSKKQVLHMGVHDVEEFEGDFTTFDLDPEVGHIRHYRDVYMENWEVKNINTILKFGAFTNTSYPEHLSKQLQNNIIERLEKVYLK